MRNMGGWDRSRTGLNRSLTGPQIGTGPADRDISAFHYLKYLTNEIHKLTKKAFIFTCGEATQVNG